MRTTVDIQESLLRKARSKAALEGIRMADVVNKALDLYLDDTSNKSTNGINLPHGVKYETHGQFTLPIIQSSRSKTSKITPQHLKYADVEEDLQRHAKIFGR